MGTLDVVAPAGIRPLLVATLAAPAPRGAGRPLLVVTATGRESEDLAASLRCYLPPAAVAEFPAWETLPHERLSPRSDTVGRRLAVLRRLAHPEEGADGPVSVIVAPIRAVMQPLVAGLGELRPVRLRSGDDAGLEETVEALAAAAYTRTDMVERRGEFAVRGGILDVFPPTRGPPAAGRVLGRHGRGGALVLRRGPALARGGRAGAVGASLPRDPPHRRRPGAGGVAHGTAPGRRRHAREDRRRHRGRGHGVAGAGAGRRDAAAARPAAGRHPRGAGRSGEDPHSRARPRRDQRGVPHGLVGQRVGGQRAARRPDGPGFRGRPLDVVLLAARPGARTRRETRTGRGGH